MRRGCPARAPCVQSAINRRRSIDLPVTPISCTYPCLPSAAKKETQTTPLANYKSPTTNSRVSIDFPRISRETPL
jgi:hypothetical protein